MKVVETETIKARSGPSQPDSLPFVTVAVSLYNYSQFIVPCLDSVYGQTLADIDLVVVDDCSTDRSVSLVTEWIDRQGNRFNRARLLRHRRNQGLACARNTGFLDARTEFVFVLDADNLIYPRCLDALLSALRVSDASFAYCYLEKFGEVVGLENVRPWNPLVLQHGNYIDAMVLHRRAVWEMLKGYATDMPAMGWEDFELWFRVARGGGWGVQVPEILAQYRVRRSSMLHMVTNPNADRLWQYLRSKYPEFFGL